MKKIITTLLCTFYLPCLFAQSWFKMILNEEGKLYIFPRYNRLAFEMPELSFKDSYTPASTIKLDMQLPDYDPEISFQKAERPMNMQTLSDAYEPFFNVYAPLYRRIYPTAFDFYEAAGYNLNDNFSFIVAGSKHTFPGSGGIQTVTASTVWSQDNWELWGGGFAGTYYTPYQITPDWMAGVTGGVNFQATEWLKLKTWGQYTFYDEKGRNNMFLFLDDHHRQTAIGGAMEFKVNENFGFGIGIQHNFNPMRNRWNQDKFIYPTFRGSNRIGISVGAGH
ncbi:MAG: hypothetical protein LIP01_09975 [Tannerellaceae bacterium]|nr:hypothetical protein [Tannerellaceae bacterium]